MIMMPEGCDGLPSPSLHGTTLLLVLSGGANRHAMLASLVAVGVKLVCYNPAPVDWARGFIADWIIGPAADPTAALKSVVRCVCVLP